MSVELDRTIYGRAADVIRKRGWASSEESPAGEACLVEALVAAEGYRAGAYDELARTLGCRPDRWNDARGRTVDDVLTLLKFAEADELDIWKSLYGPEAGE